VKSIALMSQKGGSGKSTLVRNLGIIAALNNHEVLILDTDEQATVAEWYKDRPLEKRSQSPYVVSTEILHIKDALQKAETKGFDFVFIDTPGRHSPYLDKVIEAVDFSLVPCRTTRDDIKAQIKTALQLQQQKASFAFVATQAPLRGFRRDVTFQSLESLGTVSPVQIPYLMDFQDGAACGLGVTEINPASRAAQSIQDLWAWLRDQMKEDIL